MSARYDVKIVPFPLVFANGIDPSAGPGLLFVSLPIAFNGMPFSDIVAGAFFLMLFFAALTSAISLLESCISWLTEKMNGNRTKAAITSVLAVWLLSIPVTLSMAGYAFESLPWNDKSLFDNIDLLTANILLPLGGLLIALFVGHVMSKDETREVTGDSESQHRLWVILVKYSKSVLLIGLIAIWLDLV